MILWRHGRTQWNVDGRIQGHTDIPLDTVGRVQARHAARRLASLRPAVLISSDLVRARDTAAELAGLVGLPLRVDPRLRETFFAEWEGLRDDEVAEKYGEALAQWRRGGDVPIEGAESRAQVGQRAVAAIREALVDVPPGGVLVAVTHGGTARATIATLLDLPRDRWGALGGLSNCCWSVLGQRGELDGGFQLVEHNAGVLPEPVMGDDE